jgi:hypothetical protein
MRLSRPLGGGLEGTGSRYRGGFSFNARPGHVIYITYGSGITVMAVFSVSEDCGRGHATLQTLVAAWRRRVQGLMSGSKSGRRRHARVAMLGRHHEPDRPQARLIPSRHHSAANHALFFAGTALHGSGFRHLVSCSATGAIDARDFHVATPLI